jgi:hypothetical protein
MKLPGGVGDKRVEVSSADGICQLTMGVVLAGGNRSLHLRARRVPVTGGSGAASLAAEQEEITMSLPPGSVFVMTPGGEGAWSIVTVCAVAACRGGSHLAPTSSRNYRQWQQLCGLVCNPGLQCRR